MTLTQTDLAGLRAKTDSRDGPWRFATMQQIPQLLTDLEEARALLAALLSREPWDVDFPRGYAESICTYCGNEPSLSPRDNLSGHAADCLYVKARAHLAAAGVEVG